MGESPTRARETGDSHRGALWRSFAGRPDTLFHGRPAMLSTTADHALRAVLFLGAPRDTPVVSADEIARAIGSPPNYLSKTLNALTKAGITTSTPGRYGGFSLAVPAHRLTVHDVVRVFDSPDSSPHCLLGPRPCDPSRPCVAHRRWAAIDGNHGTALRATTIADLLGQGSARRSG